MEMINNKLIDSLLGQTINRMARVALVTNDGNFTLDDTLVFHLDDGRSFELLNRQEGQLYLEINDQSPIFADFAVDADETLIEVDVAEIQVDLPMFVGGICQYLGVYGTPYLIAVTIWPDDFKSQFCLILETDEIEILGLDVLSGRIMGRPYEYGRVDQHWFPAKK